MKYEKKYKEALERAQKMQENSNGMILKKWLWSVFPELKESEDEWIRREIIDFLRLPHHQFAGKRDHEKWIAWLEKQGEKKPTNEVEPKFKVGDFITNDYCLGKVIKITNDAYLLDTGQGIPFSCEHNAHLWTIEDAKDGDVLDCEGCEYLLFKSFSNTDGRIKLYCWYNVQTNNFHGRGTDSKLRQEVNIHPATKEQRNLLFQKMKEAGYEWDAEKKELKKIEVASKESEDESIRKELIEQIAYIIPNNDEVDNEGNALPSYQERIDKYRAWLEKQGEQMTKPKFKVRDWIVDDKTPNDAFYVIEVLEEIYKVIDIEGDDYHIPHSKADKQFHLWTIDDAKKGDILVVDGTWIVEFDKKMTDGCPWKDTSILTSFEYDMDDDIYTTGSHMFYEDIWPASKEDIDLFKKKRNQYLASNSHNESKFKVGDRVVINCREEFATAYNGKEGTIINIFDLEKNHWGNIVVVLDNGMRNTFYTSELIKK